MICGTILEPIGITQSIKAVNHRVQRMLTKFTIYLFTLLIINDILYYIIISRRIVNMARRKMVEEKNYDELIKASEEKITALNDELKEEKANLKQLKKDKIKYDAIIEQRKKEEEIREVTELVIASGKSLEEIKALLK